MHARVEFLARRSLLDDKFTELVSSEQARAMHICVATDKDQPQFLSALRLRHEVKCVAVSEKLPNPRDVDALIVDVDLSDAHNIDNIRRMSLDAINARKRLFILGKKSRLAIVQAFSLGATDVLAEPILLNDLLHVVEAQNFDGCSNKVDDPSLSSVLDAARDFASLFSAAADAHPVSVSDAENATNRIHDSVVQNGLRKWLDNVRLHHTGTFQHCLMVTGLAVDFARSLGFSRRDIQRFGVIATLHDIGKSRVPVAILDKPGKLNNSEKQIMQSHAALGAEILGGMDGVSAEVLDGVRHHHEYLDGSGYPDGLGGSQLSDLVRMLTVSDIFAALIEKRGYKPPMAPQDAYDILKSMEGKLEMPLVKAFRRVALDR